MGLTRISTTTVVPKRNKFKVTMKADWFESVSASFASEGSLQNLAVTFGFVNKYPEWKTFESSPQSELREIRCRLLNPAQIC